MLLRERPLSLVYEPQQSGHTRRPDFAVTFTTRLTFMVEVTRLRADPKSTQEQSIATPNTVLTIPLIGERLADTVGSKLGQLLPQRSNVLLVGIETLHLTHDDLRAMMLNLQHRVEHNDSTFLQRHQFRDRGDFFRHYRRLSEILVRGSHLQADGPVAVWVNPQAKHPLPGKVQTTLYHSHAV